MFVSLTDMEWEGVNNSVMYCNFFSIAVTILILGLPLMILFFYYPNVDKLDSEEFQGTFGDIYDGLVIDKE